MSFNFVLLFSMTVFVASIIPGPSMLLALTHGMQYGAKRTIASAFPLSETREHGFFSILRALSELCERFGGRILAKPPRKILFWSCLRRMNMR